MALFVGLSLTLTACGDDPDPEPPAPTLSVNGSASIEANGTVYGDITVTAENTDWSVEVTVYVRQDLRRSGIGKLLYRTLEESLQRIGILNMNACIAVPREAIVFRNGMVTKCKEKKTTKNR